MTDKEVLQRAIEIAQENGYHPPMVINFNKSETPYINLELPYWVIFGHNFAKALWGDKPFDGRLEIRDSNLGIISLVVKGNEFNHEEIKKISWMVHLQQMVLKENPIDYLRKFIEDGKE